MYAIAYGKNKTALHWRQSSVSWDEILEWMSSPADKKDITGYVLGTLRPTTRLHKKDEAPCLEMHRVKDGIETRSALALDIDAPGPDFLDTMELTFGYRAVMHTTFGSAPDDPRYRLIIPTDREMAPDEYITACQTMMQRLGKDQFDQSTDQPERFMYKPAAQRPEWFTHWVFDGPEIHVDGLLEAFEPDLSSLPAPKSRNKRDPFEIEGVIGAFNRAYSDWDLLIDTYDLPYEKVDDDRYQLIGAKSEAGMGPVQGTTGLVYSHHAHDPAFGKTCSAFDLVRLHQFGELDEDAKASTPVNKLPSHSAMMEMAQVDHRVTAELVGLDFDVIMDEDVVQVDGWKMGLRLAPRSGKFVDCIQNWDLVAKHDPVFGCLAYNELTLSPEFTANVPWRKVHDRNRIVTKNDRWETVHYIEREYNIRMSLEWTSALMEAKAWKSVVNPVRDYLEKLTWDGVSRVEECLPGVRPTDYTRKVARKSLVAAVARMFEPGIKWDHTLVLYGLEGLGKSWWVEKMARGFFSSLGDIKDKDTLLQMQRSWIMLADEGHSMRKADNDSLKEFLTKTQDMFRMPYDRETLVHPRHCVIWSSTNDETFLRRQEGNRRYLIVHCEERVNFGAMTDEYIDQLWAEAVFLYRAGEQMFLSEDESTMAAEERERFIEEDAHAGVIQEYLNTLVPENWWEMSLEQRMGWTADRAQGFVTEGTEYIDRVCSIQLWVEAMGRRKGDARRTDLLDINNAMKRMPGWKSMPGRHRIPGYGPQAIFIREDFL